MKIILLLCISLGLSSCVLTGEKFYNTFVKKKDGIYSYHYQLHGNQLFLLDGIDASSFEVFNRKFFKDKNGIYILSSNMGDYEKLDADYDSFKELQDGYMQDNKCIYLGADCIDKLVDKDIQILIEGEEKNDIYYIAKDKDNYSKNKGKVSFNYKGNKVVKWITTLNGKGGLASGLKEDSKYPHNLWVFYYEEGSYTIYIFVKFSDGTTGYNKKTIKVVDKSSS